MSHNGDSDDSLEAIIGRLRFPNTMSDEESEECRKDLRDDPDLLKYVVDVEDLYGFIMGTKGPQTETKELFVRGLRYYLEGQELAYAVMVRFYVEELDDVLALRTKDPKGREMLKVRVLNHYYAFKYPPDGQVH